jgi:hypothetical protein
MAKFPIGHSRLRRVAERKWIFDTSLHAYPVPGDYKELNDNLRLRKALQRAVSRETAPSHLIDSIKKAIRG